MLFYAYQHVECLSVGQYGLICLSVWTKLEIALSRIDHFFGDGLSSLSFLFPPNVKVYVLDLSVLNRVANEAQGDGLSADASSSL
jgi:hypothetical protein